MGRYNPNYPTVLGNEMAPVATDPVRIDTGSAFGYTFRTTAREDIATARVLMTTPPPGKTLRKVISAEVYADDDAPGTGPIRKIIVPCSTGTSFLNAAVVGGGTFAEALRNPTDAKYISLTGPLAGVRVWFDTTTTNTRLTQALLNSRILDVTVRYAMTGQFEDHAVPVTLQMERVSASVVHDMDYAIDGLDFQNELVTPRFSRLGDYNPFWNTTINPGTDMRRAPWMHRNGSNNFTGLEAMGSGAGTNTNLRFLTASTVTPGVGAFNLHYCALEITYAQENRVSCGALDLTDGVSLADDMFYADVPQFSPYNYGFLWDSGDGDDYMIAVGQGYVGAISVTYPVPVTVDRLVPARDTFRGHRGVILHKTLREGEEWTREETESVPAVALYSSAVTFDATTIYPPSQVYSAQLVARADQTNGIGTTWTYISDDSIGGRVYTHIRFYARNSPQTTDYLEVFATDAVNGLLGPRAQITIEEFAALPEIADGWKEVTLELDPAYNTTPVGGPRRWQFQAATSPNAPWEILGGDSNPYRDSTVGTVGSYYTASYGGVTSYAVSENVSDFFADMTVMLIQALEVPGTLTVEAAVQPLSLLDESCGVPVEAMPTGIRYHELSWGAVNDLAVAGFLHYEVQRRDTTMPADEWETVGEITAVTVTAMDDYEARVGVVSSYRVRQVHEDGYTSGWSNTATSTIVAPGVTGTGVSSSLLILTSNQNPAGNLAYVATWEGAGGVNNQDFTYPEGGQTAYQSMYGRDYRVAFRPLERAGVEFTRQVLVNAVGVPTLTADKALLALRDLAWDTVPYICTRDEASNRWLAAISVPNSATRDIPTTGHLVLAPVSFVEVTGTPAPVDYESGCEGLRLEGPDTFQYWNAPAPAAMGGTRQLTDTFTRTVANGWGTATTGQVWTASGGGLAADFSTNGTTGRIASNTVTVDRRVTAATTFNYHRTKVSFTIPAVATAGVYTAGLLTRFQDDSNYYLVRVEFAVAGTYKLDLVRVVAGVATTVVSGAAITTYTVGTVINLEVMTRGTHIAGRVWKDAATPPGWGTSSAGAVFNSPTNTTLALTGKVGVLQNRAAANTNAALTLNYDNFTVDSLPMEYDLRMLVRPFEDTFIVQYGTDDFTNTNDSEGNWSVYLSYGSVGIYIFGFDFSQIESTKVSELGLVKNHLTWVRVTVTLDATGAELFKTYYLADDGVTWTLVDTVTEAAPVQPMPPLMTGGLLEILNNSPGGIWTHKVELRLDGVLVYNPDFEAQATGTQAFTDGSGNNWSTDSGRGICDTLE